MSATSVCPTCGASYPASERFCPRDGAALGTAGRVRMPVLVGGGLAVAVAVIGAALLLSPASPRSRRARELPAPSPLPAAITATAVAERIPALLDESRTASGAALALATARSLIPRAAHPGDLAGLALVQAQALGMLGRDAERCSVLEAARGRADGTPYAARIAHLLEDGCRPRNR